jgi:hypothetical protein
MNRPQRHDHPGPKSWKYLLGATLAFVILVPLWMAIDLMLLRPDVPISLEAMMNKLWWLGVPAVAVTLLFGGRWIMASQQAQTRQSQFKLETAKAQQVLAEARTEQGHREYVLEVISMGVTLDKYRQGKLWEALQKGHASATIREMDPMKYDWTALDKIGTAGSRASDALENGAFWTVSEWGVPAFNAKPACHALKCDSPITPRAGLVAGANSNGMHTHLFVAGPRRFEERPDRILEDIFAFFDANPDIPYVVLNSDDGMDVREKYQPDGSPDLVKQGYYVTEMPDSATLFLLARRERVEAVRPFAYDDIDDYGVGFDVINRDGVARRLYVAYDALSHALPQPLDSRGRPNIIGRLPLIAEWLPAAAKFAQRPDIRGTGPISFLDREFNDKHRPPRDWKPTPWFPVPWSKRQLAQFDSLPTMGFIHRPVFVKTTDDHGKPLHRRDLRADALLAGWHEALKTLPEAERAKGPARIIAATGEHLEQTQALESMLHRYAEQGGPEIDSGKIDQFINTDRRLGNTGATTLFMQMAIGVMGSYRAGGISAAINLRDTGEASIIFISPPSDAVRVSQDGRIDVFKGTATPSIDPANYAEPGASRGAPPQSVAPDHQASRGSK